MLRLLLLFCALALAPRAMAAPNNITAELVAEGPGAPGGTVWLAFHMKPAAGWHGYWRNPGDAGLGMITTWTLPAGAKAGDLAYPVPQTLLVSGLMNHVYKGDYALLVPLTLPAKVAPGARMAVAVAAQWLACTDTICVPEQARLSTMVEVGTPRSSPQFDLWRAALPAPLGSEASFALSGQGVRLAIPLPAAVALDAPHFFIGEDKVADYAGTQAFFRKGDTLIVELARAKFAPQSPGLVTGVLRLNPAGDGLDISARPGPVPSGGTRVQNAAPQTPPLGAAWCWQPVAGGLLLNVMPCVFPILSLKALSLARAGESQAEARTEGLAYTAGVVLACAALGAVLLALRAGGAQIGWAFQLQEPLVVAALLLLAVAITANLAGLYEFAVPFFAREGAPQGAFATGLLAAFAATPCTGPFMAAAMGAALLLPPLPAMLLFVALGLGLALPFLAIAYVPALRRRLPRPGQWMVTFRHWMAVPMGLTALALVWLASRLGGTLFALGCGALAVLLVLALALAGRRQRAGRSALALVTGALAVVIGAGAIALPSSIRAPSSEAAGILPARPFSEQALAEARAAGRPVFAWFTADWCLTCKVNEQVAIEREDVRDAFARSGVIVLRGDWTRRDPEITRYLTAQGAAGVPLYVWYPAGNGAPEVLPQVLSASLLIEQAEKSRKP